MFCVLMNRLFAVATALALVLLSRNRRPFSHADLLRCAPAALSNTASSFGQYQALRYISFPLQTITKSTKLIPVMLMGRLLNRTAYPFIEYLEAVAISIGCSVFAFERKK